MKSLKKKLIAVAPYIASEPVLALWCSFQPGHSPSDEKINMYKKAAIAIDLKDASYYF
jgi:hypothetical protein